MSSTHAPRSFIHATNSSWPFSTRTSALVITNANASDIVRAQHIVWASIDRTLHYLRCERYFITLADGPTLTYLPAVSIIGHREESF